ncbi:MAG: TetR family transcriptional regulator [Propionibacteriaceae bacterium]
MAERQLVERRLTRRGQITRDRIVDVATALIALHGVAGTSTEQVRAEAGVSGSQLYHYFDSKQALIRAVITRQADSVGAGGTPEIGALDSLDALQAWADAAIERQAQHDGRGDCTLSSLAGELSGSDEDSRAELCTGFLRWKALLEHGLGAMQARGELRADADLATLAYALLAALQGGTLLSQTMGSVDPMRAAMDAAIAYVRSFSDTV